MAGRIRPLNCPLSIAGSQCSRTLKISTSTRTSKNAMIVIPRTTGSAAARRRSTYAATSGDGGRMEHEVSVQRRGHALHLRLHGEREVDIPHRKVHRVLHQLHGHLLVECIAIGVRSEEHTSELQSQSNLVCRL